MKAAVGGREAPVSWRGRRGRWPSLVLLCGVLAACASGQTGGPVAAAPAEAAESAWSAQRLPGKRETIYAASNRQGRPCVEAVADRSASLWRRRTSVAVPQLDRIDFSWWVHNLAEGASVAEASRDDAAARVVLAFEGDDERLSLRNRALFDLAEAMTGERPPHSTLMYVWDATAPVGSVIVSSRSDRVRKIVVESGAQRLGQWRDYERDLVGDFRRAFGEEPGPLTGVAYMTDGDNTGSRVRACYGRSRLRGREID